VVFSRLSRLFGLSRLFTIWRPSSAAQGSLRQRNPCRPLLAYTLNFKRRFQAGCLTLLCILATWPQVSAKGIDAEFQHITLSLSQEPPNLDTSLSEDTTSAFILGLINEPLVRVDRRGKIQPAVASSWRLQPKSATFSLRRDARWSNGQNVTAHDFVYAWRRLVDPRTAAAGSSFFADLLLNGKEILAGQLPPEDLGVVALDDYTLEVTLSRPAPYLLNVLSGTPYMPLNEAFVSAQQDRYGADASNLLSNGPFKLDSWVHSASMSMSRNVHYWNQAKIKLNGIKIGYITADNRSLLNLFKSGELAALTLDEDILEDASAAGYRINKAPSNCMAWLILNMRPDRPTASRKLRQAIRLSINRDTYINNIIGMPGVEKIESVLSGPTQGLNGRFQTEYPANPIDFDISQAKRLLSEARAELGLMEMPPIILLANETRQIDAEFVQSQLQNGLGLDVRVDKQTFKQAIAKMHAGEFDIARAAFCGGSVFDPVFFAGIFQSRSPYNDGGFQHPTYDQLLTLTHSTNDQLVRMNAFGKMQQILFEEAPIIPTHIYSQVYIQNERLKGLVRYPVIDFSKGYIDN